MKVTVKEETPEGVVHEASLEFNKKQEELSKCEPCRKPAPGPIVPCNTLGALLSVLGCRGLKRGND